MCLYVYAFALSPVLCQRVLSPNQQFRSLSSPVFVFGAQQTPSSGPTIIYPPANSQLTHRVPLAGIVIEQLFLENPLFNVPVCVPLLSSQFYFSDFLEILTLLRNGNHRSLGEWQGL